MLASNGAAPITVIDILQEYNCYDKSGAVNDAHINGYIHLSAGYPPIRLRHSHADAAYRVGGGLVRPGCACPHANRSPLNAHCYWLLRKQDQTMEQATQALLKLSVAAKNELLFQNGVNFNDLPNWQKRGIGLYWETYEKPGLNPKTNEAVLTTRRRIGIDYDLPMKDAYETFIRVLLLKSNP